MTLRPLYPDQQHGLDLLRNAIGQGYRRPMFQAPCGYGKTVLSAHIVSGILDRGKRVCFTAPAVDLIDQTFDRFVENGIDAANMGVIQGNHPWRRPHAPVQIATPQTLSRRDLPNVDVVVVDEAHVRHKVIDGWMAQDPQRIFIGLTATPWSRGLGKRYDTLIKPTSVKALIEAGRLSPFRVYAPSHPDLTGVKTVGGDYDEGELGQRMNQPTLVADVVTTWCQRGRGLPTLCFATGRMHAKSIYDRFDEAGVRVAYVDAHTPRDERILIGRRLAVGDVEVVVNIGCLTTGIDWDVRCISLCRPTKSEALFVQIIGRGLRTADGKEFCTILDHSDTHLRLGMVDDIDHDELDDGSPKQAKGERKAKSLPLPKECHCCGALVPVYERACLACGTEKPMPVAEFRDGELAEMTRMGGRIERKPGQPIREALAEIGPREIYKQLRGIQIERGRSDGWTSHAYKEIFGVWPDRALKNLISSAAVPMLRSWIRSRDIAYAKSRNRMQGGSHDAA